MAVAAAPSDADSDQSDPLTRTSIAGAAPDLQVLRPRRWRRWTLGALLLFTAGLLLPERAQIPVAGASRADWNPRTFWHEPWGASGVHKGIDIFAPTGRPVVSATAGIVVFRGELKLGGQVVAVLGPKWRIHYYAHLSSFADEPWLVASGTPIGAVGSSGNAVGKSPHLHYTVLSLIPLPWLATRQTQGWRRMFYLDPGALFTEPA